MTHQTTVIKEELHEEPVKKYRWLIIGGIIVLIGIILGITYWVKKKKAPAPPENKLSEIQQAFTPPSSTSTHLSITTSTPPTATTSSSPNPIPSGPIPTPAPAPVVYNNPALGFSIILPEGWQVDEKNSTQNRIVFVSNKGEQGIVEALTNSTGENLGDITASLQSNPVIRSLKNTFVDAKQAIAYYGTSAKSSGIAALNGDKIYYLYDNFASGDTLLKNFHFTANPNISSENSSSGLYY